MDTEQSPTEVSSPASSSSALVQSPHRSTERTTIAKLPNEVLLIIFHFAACGKFAVCQICKNSYASWCRTLSALMLVCHRWRSLAESRYYASLLFDEKADWQVDRSMLHTASLLAERVDLRQRVQRLRIAMENSGTPFCRLMSRIVGYCEAINQVEISAPLGPEHWPFIDGIRSRPLRELFLTTADSGPSINFLFSYLSLPTLEVLYLTNWGWSSSDGFEPDAEECPDDELVQQLAGHPAQQLPNLRVLYLVRPACSPAVTECLLKWPSKLETLYLQGFGQSKYAFEYSVLKLQELLQIHCTSLKTVSIGKMTWREQDFPDMRPFPCLESLAYQASDVFNSEPQAACSLLCSPRLRRLTLNVSFDGPPRLSFRFPDGWLSWLEEFFLGLFVQTPSTTLKRIDVFCRPRWPETSGAPRAVIKPIPSWPSFERAARMAYFYGFLLTWNNPCAEDEWHLIRQLRQLPPCDLRRYD